jgi:hypothetical protein
LHSGYSEIDDPLNFIIFIINPVLVEKLKQIFMLHQVRFESVDRLDGRRFQLLSVRRLTSRMRVNSNVR